MMYEFRKLLEVGTISSEEALRGILLVYITNMRVVQELRIEIHRFEHCSSLKLTQMRQISS
jgi:hypothetical protein